MPQTLRLALPLIAAGQSQKDVTHNEALLRLDRIVALAVVSRSQSQPPPNPTPGDIHIVPAVGAAGWGRGAGTLMQWQGTAWHPETPLNGQLAYVADEGALLVHDDGWQHHLPVAGLLIAGRSVLAAPVVAIADPGGGTTVDAEARAVLVALLAALRTQGLLAT